MSKSWRRLLAVGCAISMLMTAPGMKAFAAEAPSESMIIEEVPVQEQAANEFLDEEQVNDTESLEDAETVNEGIIADGEVIAPSEIESADPVETEEITAETVDGEVEAVDIEDLESVTGLQSAGEKLSFSDVQDPSHPFYTAIYWAVDKGITKGYPDGTFGINRSCTRGEMIMFLWRYVGKPTPTAVSKSPFTDVPTNHAFYNAIL